MIGLSLSGVGSLKASNLQIQRLSAGNGFINRTGHLAPSYRGGNATGVAVSGTYDVNMISSSITDLTAGDAGDANQDGLSCSGEGGHAVGIEAFSSDVKLDAVEIRNLQGGAPCRGRGAYCFDRAGSYSGIMIDGGRLTLTNSTIDNLHAYAGHGSPINSATWVQNAIAVRIQNLRIDHGVTSIPAEPNTTVHNASVDTYPFCFPPPLKVQSVSLNNVTQVDLTNLDARNVIGYGTRATSAGLFIQDADSVSLHNSKISNVHGGYGGLNAHGMYLARINQLTINATAIHSVEAQAGPPHVDHTYNGDDGGSATGLTIDDVKSGSITGTSIWRVVGGDAKHTEPFRRQRIRHCSATEFR